MKVKVLMILVVLYFTAVVCKAQDVVFDPEHFMIVAENAAVRSAAEQTHNQYLSNINNNLQMINANVGSVVLAQTMIYRSLSNVNSALKNGLMLKDMAIISADILQYTKQTLDMARSDPALPQRYAPWSPR